MENSAITNQISKLVSKFGAHDIDFDTILENFEYDQEEENEINADFVRELVKIQEQYQLTTYQLLELVQKQVDAYKQGTASGINSARTIGLKTQISEKTPLQVNNKWIIYLLNIVIIVYNSHYYIIII
ncbi:Hypothetical_protein [Hexamita inflata]|uniref:Hypothetical_protein n=1 Tax=Hexamita inflata TaxID=28002 RepID=A0ABP1GHN2_9EUKA